VSAFLSLVIFSVLLKFDVRRSSVATVQVWNSLQKEIRNLETY